jgi:hypothetical protein
MGCESTAKYKLISSIKEDKIIIESCDVELMIGSGIELLLLGVTLILYYWE